MYTLSNSAVNVVHVGNALLCIDLYSNLIFRQCGIAQVQIQCTDIYFWRQSRLAIFLC
jgi:hypothetical protein